MTYAIRLPTNNSLERDIAGLLTRPFGRPSHQPVIRHKSFLYQASRWDKARSVVATVAPHRGEWFPRGGFIVTSVSLPSRAVVRFYNTRGTAEQRINEGQQAVRMTRLSRHRFRSNAVRRWLSVIADHLGSLWRRLVLPNTGQAILAAMFVEAGKLRWDSTVAEVFPELAEKMDAGQRRVTLEQLLLHTSGIPSDNDAFVALLDKAMLQDGNLDALRY